MKEKKLSKLGLASVIVLLAAFPVGGICQNLRFDSLFCFFLYFVLILASLCLSVATVIRTREHGWVIVIIISGLFLVQAIVAAFAEGF